MTAGSKEKPWLLKTAPGTSAYSMYLDGDELVCVVGSTTLKYQARAIEELGIDPDVLVEDFGPHQLVPFIAGPDHEGETPADAPYVREEQEKRLRKAERGLSALGRVNPLALE